VQQTNIKPENFAQAVCLQRPKVTKALKEAVAKCAEMVQEMADVEDFANVFHRMLEEKHLEVLLRQSCDGPDGVVFNRKKAMDESK